VHGGTEQAGAADAVETVSTRQRVLDAARALATDGGIGAVRMRDVSRRSGVPEHELYQHFSSTEHLMVLAQREWIRDAMDAAPLPTGADVDGGDRVAELVHRSLVATAAAPRFVAAVFASMSSLDPAVRRAHRESNREVSARLKVAVGTELDDVDGYIELIGVTWIGVLTAWTLGNMAIAEADRIAQRSARLLYRSMLLEQSRSNT